MRKTLIAFAALVALALPARAQTNWPTPGGSQANGDVPMCLNSSGQAVPQWSTAGVWQCSGTPPITVPSTASYRAVTFGNTAYATPQDLACLQNPAASGKTVYVTQLGIMPQQTTGALQTFLFLKRTTLNSGGTSAAATSVALDSGDASAAASLLTYTAAPTPGTSAGSLNQGSTNVVATTNAPVVISLFGAAPTQNGNSTPQFPATPGTNTLTQPITLHASEEICVNFNGAALPSGFTAGYIAEWTEK